jgi:protein-L-isoaspartate(D-aspartate) O-methyltransferase
MMEQNMDIKLARFNMIEQQIRTWNVFDLSVLNLFETVSRENFVLDKYKNLAFADLELPLPGFGRMLSPKIEARMLQELATNKADKVLEVGTGSGYVTALLAKLGDFVYSIEIDEVNRNFALQNLLKSGVKNVSISLGDGNLGLPSKAPFDRIFVGYDMDEVTLELKQQLSIGGKLVAIVGKYPVMEAVLIVRKSASDFTINNLFETCLQSL